MADLKNTFGTGLVSVWEMESGALTTDSHGSNTLTDVNTVGSGTGIQGGCGDFRKAQNEYLSIASACSLTHQNITVSLWFKPTSQPASNNLYMLFKCRTTGGGTNYIDWYVTYYNQAGTKKLRLQRNKPGVAAAVFDYNTTMSDGSWYHIVMTYDTATLKGYINGTEVISQAASGVGTGGANSLSIGWGAEDYAGLYTDGLLDQVAIWTTALSGANVATLYNSGNGIPYEETGGGATVVPPQIITW